MCPAPVVVLVVAPDMRILNPVNREEGLDQNLRTPSGDVR
jgi:hypothetical protein